MKGDADEAGRPGSLAEQSVDKAARAPRAARRRAGKARRSGQRGCIAVRMPGAILSTGCQAADRPGRERQGHRLVSTRTWEQDEDNGLVSPIEQRANEACRTDESGGQDRLLGAVVDVAVLERHLIAVPLRRTPVTAQSARSITLPESKAEIRRARVNGDRSWLGSEPLRFHGSSRSKTTARRPAAAKATAASTPLSAPPTMHLSPSARSSYEVTLAYSTPVVSRRRPSTPARCPDRRRSGPAGRTGCWRTTA